MPDRRRMLDDSEAEYLFRALRLNNCLLFVGAGFSTAALSKRNEPVPTGSQLAKQIWDWLGGGGSYDGSPLSQVYQGALSVGRRKQDFSSFLDERLVAKSAPSAFAILPRIFWFRLYGTNADDVVEWVYRHWPGESKLRVIDALDDDYEDRDQFLREIQYIKLNGSWPRDPTELTFSQRAYAKRAAEHDRWYDHFVRDYVQHPVLFVGSQLNEPLFWQALEARRAKARGGEERPKSFIVTPNASPVQLAILRELNVIHVPAESEDFFEWLVGRFAPPDRSAILKEVIPEAASILLRPEISARVVEALEEMLGSFSRVPSDPSPERRQADFFRGASPTWGDISQDLDAPRDMTPSLLEGVQSALADESRIAVFGVLGTGGSGKTTVLRRAALALRQGRSQVFFSDGTTRPNVAATAAALDSLPERAVIFIDSAHLLGPVLHDLVKRFERCARPPVVVFASRFNLFERSLRPVADEPFCRLFELADLSDAEIYGVLAKLRQHVQLGKLEALSEAERFREFKVRAQKQLLVSMREATEGKGFDAILRDEFGQMEDAESRLLYLCAALGTAEGVDLTKDQFIASAACDPAEVIARLRRGLKGLVVESDEGRLVGARHALIAEFLVERAASRADLKEAYHRVLNTLSHDVYKGRGRRGRAWRLLVHLISHATIYRRFGENIEMARSIFEQAKAWLRQDWNFWLQYANLEIEYGQLEFARPHLAHAEGLMPGDPKVVTTRAHLLFREAIDAPTGDEATTLRLEAEQILLEQIARDGPSDEYPFHVYLKQRARWIRTWIVEKRERAKLFEEALEVADQAMKLHGYSRKIRDAVASVKEEYLLTAT
jgi:SIR2-like domain